MSESIGPTLWCELSAKDHLIALLYGQLSGAESIREITDGLESHSARLYPVGAQPVAKSTFADANAARSCGLFADLFAVMLQQAGRGMRVAECGAKSVTWCI